MKQTLLMAVVVLGAVVLPAPAASPNIVISQVYGGAGCGTAGCSTYKNDYIELFNKSGASVNVNGWSVQYASATGTSWQVTSLPNVSIPAGGYYLVGEGAGANGISNLPATDASGSIAMSATAAKVALVSSTTALTLACPTGGPIVDFVGYGTTANCSETAVAPGPSTTNAIFRAGGGCTDTDNNSADFTAAAASARNSSTTANSCGASSNPSGIGASSPNSVPPGAATKLTVTVTPGANPASTGITVTGDLTAIGGSATQQFFDDGTNGNVTSGDKIYTFTATVAGDTAAGGKTLPVSIADQQSRTGSASIALTVQAIVLTNPSGTGAASPNSVLPGASTLLTVTVTPGANPTSTGISVTGDLTAIGGSATQQFYNDGTHGDVTSGDSIYSFSATVSNAASPGSKSLPLAITDLDGRSATPAPSIALTVQAPPSAGVRISQVYGGGGNSGATFKNDFIELFNQSDSPVDVSTWSVQKASANLNNWEITNLCPSGGTCVIQPGRYYLVQEAQGNPTVVQVDLPAPDATGIIAMGAASGKIALVSNTTLLTVNCPSGAGIVDFAGYGGAAADCFEGSGAAGTASNTSGATRKNNGCQDTDSNTNDFVIGGPIPRNSASPANYCGGDPTRLSGIGSAAPQSLEPQGTLLLAVKVTPASVPASTGMSVTGNLTAIGGIAAQSFYDDGTHGDATPADNTFSYQTVMADSVNLGAKSIQTTITDAQARTGNAPITVSAQAPTCGTERWAVKTGTDPNAGLVNLANPQRTTIEALRNLTAPVLNPNPPYDPRFSPTEYTAFTVNGILTAYKLEDDVDYHIVIQDPTGNTMITEIPSPACDGSSGPFDSFVAGVRAKFDGRFTATGSFQSASVPVWMKGVGFFDFLHGQNGVAPNGIELHPILDMNFTNAATTVVTSTANPSTYGQSVTLTATVTAPGPFATGDVHFFEGDEELGQGALDATGKATFGTSSLPAGPHSITAYYDGDFNVAQSTSAVFTQNVGQASSVVTWSNPADIIFGGALGSTQLNATASVPGSFNYTPAAGTVLPVGNGQTLSVVFTPTSSNYASAAKSVQINVLPASAPASPASLVVTRSLARVSGQVVVTLTIANNGGTDAENVTLTGVKIPSTGANGTPLPQSLGTIPAGGSVSAVVNFPGTVGAAGTASTLSVAGTFSGGSFGSTARITLP